MNQAAETIEAHRHRLSVDDFHKMGSAGVFGDNERIKLIQGEIVDMAPIGSRHAFIVNQLAKFFTQAGADSYLVSSQNPIRMGEQSEPQPDIAPLRPDNYMDQLPTEDDVLLVIEVADSSIDYDLNVEA